MPAPDLIADRIRLSFLEEQRLALPRPMTALEVWNRMMARPLPMMATAMRIRDAISARFGVERIGGFSGRPASDVATGDRLDFFLVERSEPERLTLTARDWHLEVITCVTTGGARLAITTSVRVKNRFGRTYLLPVGPAHRLIVWWMLRRLKRDLADQTAG
jgi:hypothetical protein